MSDLEIVDAHHHLWDLQVGYPWLSDGSGSLSAIHGDDSSLRYNYGPPEFLSESKTYRVSGSVAIEAAAADPLAEARYLQRCAEEAQVPDVFVAGGRLEEPGWPAVLQAYSELDRIRGVRQILCWHPDPGFSYIADSDLVKRDSWRRGFRQLAQYELSFDLQIYPWQSREAAALAADHPSTVIILNHAGMLIDRTSRGQARWREAMAELAEQPNVCAKISGLTMLDHGWTPDSIREVVLQMIGFFGIERIMFASNFPVDRLHGGYDQIYEAFDRITATFTNEERECLFSANASRIYRFPDSVG